MYTDIEKLLKQVMVDGGYINDDWRIKIIKVEPLNNASDYVYLYVDVYKPRCKKPKYWHKIKYDTARSNVYWNQSEFGNY